MPFEPFDQKVPTKELTVISGNQAALGWFLGSKRKFLDKNFEIAKIPAPGPAIMAVLANFAIFEFLLQNVPVEFPNGHIFSKCFSVISKNLARYIWNRRGLI